MAVPVVEAFVASDSGGSAVTSLLMTAPSGITSGELLIIIIGNDDTGSADEFTTTPAGWTKLDESGSTSADAHMGVFYKVASGSEGNVTINAASSDEMMGWYMRLSGADVNTPIQASSFNAAGDSNSHAVTGVTTTVDDTLVFYGLIFDGGTGDPFSVSGTGWTESDEHASGTGSADVSGCFGTRSLASLGASGTATVSCDASSGAAFAQFAISPPVDPSIATIGIEPPAEEFQVSAASYNGSGEEFSVTNEDTFPEGIFFQDDGTRMFLIGNQGDAVVEYDLSTAWDVSTASYNGAGEEFSVSSQETTPRGIFFKPDGLRLFVVGDNDDVVEYDLSTAWDVSTASYNGSSREFDVSNEDTAPRGLSFTPDGKRMFIVGDNGNDLIQYDLSTAWQVNTASYSGAASELDVSGEDTSPRTLFFKPDGSRIFLLGAQGDAVVEYDIDVQFPRSLIEVELILAPTGIASAEAFGAVVAVYDQFLTLTGIASSEAFGSSQLNLSVSLTGVPSAESFGSTSISYIVDTIGIASLEAFGTQSVSPGAVDLSPSGLISLEAFGSHEFSVEISVTSIASLEAFGAGQLDLNIPLTGIASLESVQSPTVSPGAVNLSVPSISTSEAFGTFKIGLEVISTGIASLEAFGSPQLNLNILTSGISTAEFFGSHIVIPDIDSGSFHRLSFIPANDPSSGSGFHN